MSHDQRARGGAQGHGQASGQAAGAAGGDAITQGHTAVQLLEGGSLFPRISTWAAHAIETANFAAAREASMRWNINRPYLRTLAQSLDPTDHFVARAQALLDDMAPLEAKLPDLIDLAGSADSAKGKARWMARLGRMEKAKAAPAEAAEEVPPPAVHSPLRPENVKSDGLDLGDLAAGALGVGVVLWAEQHRDSINPVEHEAANVITKLTENPAYTSGFVVGGIEGAWAAVKDNAHFIVEIGEFFVDMVKAQIAGGDLGVLMALRDKVMDMIAAGRQVPAAIKAFADRWNDASDPYGQGHFQGHAVGYMAVQILALVVGALTPVGPYADVVRVLKLATDPVSGLVDLAVAAKAARTAKLAGKVEHAVEGAVAGERAGAKAAEGAAQGERRLGGVFEDASTPGRADNVGGSLHVDQPAPAREQLSGGEPNRPAAGRDSSIDPQPAMKSPWETGAKVGVEPTEASIRVGEVRMELHPDYASVIAEIKQAGFEVRRTGKARVAVERVVDETGQVLETRRFVEVIPGMRFLDLEHELGHVRQLEALGPGAPATETFERAATGVEREAYNELRVGTLTKQENAVFEYHNRINEWVRLAEREAAPELLAEHAQGIEYWRIKAENKLGRSGGRGSFDVWARTAVPDLPVLEARARSLGLELGRTTWRW